MTQGNQDQIIKSQMEKMVDSYDAYMNKITFGRERVLRQVTIDLAGIKPGDCVLEVGCGTGSLSLAAIKQAGASGRIFGIDIIPGMVEASQRKAALAQQEITFQLGSIDNIPFPENSFDVVMGSFMIFHMSEETRRKGLSEVQRVLKPGGRLLIVDLSMPTQPLAKAITRLTLGWMLDHDVQELIPLMEATRFSGVETGLAKFRIFGLPLIGYVRGSVVK